MTTDISTQTDLESFHKFVGGLLKQGKNKLTLKEGLAAYREYQNELKRLREELQPALEQSARGESEPLDIEAMKAEVTKKLADQGITE